MKLYLTARELELLRLSIHGRLINHYAALCGYEQGSAGYNEVYEDLAELQELFEYISKSNLSEKGM